MANSQEAAQAILNGPDFETVPGVEIFVDHVLKDRTGKVVRKVDKAALEKIAQDALQRFQASGDLAPFGPGHTFDDEYEFPPNQKPRLVRKFPETEQPPVWGYFDPRYSVQQRPGDGKWALYANARVRRVITYNDGTAEKTINGRDAFKEFPRRSPEYYAPENRLDYVALLRRTPKLDMGLTAYAKNSPDRAFWVPAKEQQPSTLVAVVGVTNKIRYAIGVEDMAIPSATPARYEPDPEMHQDPTHAPVDNPVKEAEAAGEAQGQAEAKGADGFPEGETGDEHRYAAELYAKHAFGMHHSRAKHLMHRYAKECGMAGDMMSPMEEAAPQRNAMTTPGETNGSPPAPAAPVHHPEPHRMSRANTMIDQSREQKKYAELEDRLNQAEWRETAARYQGELIAVKASGKEVDVDEEMKFLAPTDPATGRQMAPVPRQMFDAHVERIKRYHRDIESPDGQEFVVPSHGYLPMPMPRPTGVPKKSPQQEAAFAQEVTRYMNQKIDEGELEAGPRAWDRAKEMYEKEATGKVR